MKHVNLLCRKKCRVAYWYAILVHTVTTKAKNGKFHSRTGHEGPQTEYSYNSTFSFTWALYWDEWSRPRSGCFIHKNDILCRKYDETQGRSGQVWKVSPPPGFDLRTVQPVARPYTE
jgi:hypothetical protein